MVKGLDHVGELLMIEAEFNSTLDPVAMIKNRTSVSGPQPAEMARIGTAANQSRTLQGDWIWAKCACITPSLAKLDSDFGKIAPAQ